VTIIPAGTAPPISFPGITPRSDFAYPLRVDPVSGQTTQSAYAAHVQQMVYQLLMTNPGERVNQPQFGCGIRGLVFAPITDALAATLQLRVLQALSTWLAGIVVPGNVEVTSSGAGGIAEPGTVVVSVSYTVVDTQTQDNVAVTIL
jgi:phage baseplate assembly protein W